MANDNITRRLVKPARNVEGEIILQKQQTLYTVTYDHKDIECGNSSGDDETPTHVSTF